MTEQALSFDLQDKLYRVLQDNPDWRDYLQQMIEYEDAHYRDEYYMGWQWQDVHTPISVVNRMITLNILDLKSKSRQYSYYMLRSREDTRAALHMDDPSEAEKQPIDVSGLFSLVIGHDNIKQLLRLIISGDRPVHGLISGPPGSAKTMMLSDIARLPGAEMYEGSTTTKSGLVSMLLTYRPSYLILDEIDKMGKDDMTPLLSLLESGMVTLLQHGRNERLSLSTRVFVGANDPTKLSAATYDRFVHFAIPPYTMEEYTKVGHGYLIKNEGCSPHFAGMVVKAVTARLLQSKQPLQIRRLRDVARMARVDEAMIPVILDTLWPEKRLAPVTPLRRE